MAFYTLSDYRTQFKDFVGDTSLSTAVCDKWLKLPYENVWRFLVSSRGIKELPLTITMMQPAFDTTLSSYYITLPDTAVAWKLPKNDQVSQKKVGTNYLVYLLYGGGLQPVEYINKPALPSDGATALAYDSDLLMDVICRDASERYYNSIKAYAEADRARGKRKEAIQHINQKYLQQFIYNAND